MRIDQLRVDMMKRSLAKQDIQKKQASHEERAVDLKKELEVVETQVDGDEGEVNQADDRSEENGPRETVAVLEKKEEIPRKHRGKTEHGARNTETETEHGARNTENCFRIHYDHAFTYLVFHLHVIGNSSSQ